ncbi:FtsX-like permease family protein, partial [uncultured Subdoligranulum sp.]|uniref:ABC transporter permease n=1 Tax=uncultured Subdoligranulum sp. TaxID=512298 RepID=UPI0026043217
MMKHYLDLAARSDRVHRRQSRMTRLCIVLAVFLVAVMFGLADMYLQGMVIETRQNTGDWHCKFTGLDRESAAFVASRPEVDFSGWQGTTAPDAGCTLGGLPAALAGMDEALFARVYGGVFSEGHAPAAQEEIAVSDALAQAAGLAVGDRAALQGPGGTVYCTVTGIFPAQAGQATAGSAQTVLLPARALAETGTPGTVWQYVVQFSPLCRMADVIDGISRTNGLDAGQVLVNEELLSLLGQLPGSNVNQIYSMAALLSLVVMATCILMISSSLNSNVSQRTAFFGLMRCLGATRRQTARFVRREALQWCVAAIPVGLGLSILVVWALCAVMRHFSSVWFGSIPLFGVSWLSLGAATVLGLLTVLLAARTPARQAARVSPLEAAAGNPGQARPFRRAATTRRWPVEIALGVHHARAG